MNEIYRLIITVEEIQGRCPVFKVGDKIIVEEPEIITEKTDTLCVHALAQCYL